MVMYIISRISNCCRHGCFLAILLSSPWLCGNSVRWEVVEPDLAGIPDIGNCRFQDVSGHGGYFYAWICLSADPWEAVYRSADGLNWELVVEGTRTTSGFALEDGRTLLYREGDSSIVIGDGENWTVRDLSEIEGADQAGVLSVAQSNTGRLVLGGTQTFRRVPRPCWWVSNDGGETFTFFASDRDFPFRSEAGLSGMAFGNGVFVGVGIVGESWVGVNGESWAEAALPAVENPDDGESPLIKTIRFYDGAFWAVGNYTRVYRSENGREWTVVHEGGGNNLLDELLIDGDSLHATGSELRQAWSPDRGVSWFSAEASSTGNGTLTGGRGLAFFRGVFAPTGDLLDHENEIVFEIFPSIGSFSQIAYTEGTWLAFTDGTYFLGRAEGHFLDRAVSVDGIFFEHPWFGWFTLRSENWLYHFNLGWIYTESSSGTSVWIATDGLGWIFTSDSLWPNFYHPHSENWGLYADSSEWFFNSTTGDWQKRASFGG